MYACRAPIANSNKVYPALILRVKINSVEEFLNIKCVMYAPIITIITCPVLIFAASRNDRVIGRTKTLIHSIINRNGANHLGAPLGINLLINLSALLDADDIIIANQEGKARVKVKSMCEERLKV